LKKTVGLQEIELTQEFQTALDMMENTNQSVFITGKAGTGKTTLIELYRQETKKNVVVLAPTGVAALKIQGKTIHSFFEFPLGLIDKGKIDKLFNKKLEVIEKINTIVIDEVSMVRADLMDSIDYSLRLNRNIDEPFGGVQMILVGDMYQLPPVVDDGLAPYFSNKKGQYHSPWFFSSEVIRDKDRFYQLLNFIELTHIFRQDQETQKQFIDILNDLRVNKIDDERLDMLNTRFKIGQKPEPNEVRLTICTKRGYANFTNNRKLGELPSKAHIYEAEIEGSFNNKKNQGNYPTEQYLKLKKGSQIMMIKNDKEKRWVNGSLGLVHKLTYNNVSVDIHGIVSDIERETWEEIQYIYDSKTKKVTSEVVGTFTQYPISLAWAFTIHKSQGQTFDKVSIMAQGAWEHGQIYVAVSRCKTLEGIILETPIRRNDIHVNPIIEKFLNTMRNK
jgi:ATP-dependent exoDNAse (exonuclease V) alpha subunit